MIDRGDGGGAAYQGSKAAVVTISETLSFELARVSSQLEITRGRSPAVACDFQVFPDRSLVSTALPSGSGARSVPLPGAVKPRCAFKMGFEAHF